ncbi:MAG TPA: biopolymer transporter ExbD [candidate division WOR-3 bacterium]|uniref:Biopolymer transporter ExbD n=1 Tax=candidate division WOR-3 bacterium TaxID=2052148 RepID=A0A7V0T6I7_UNCW3|nr:biopolymer transporter ExbD [candidate division WOR-3 bacterium]
MKSVSIDILPMAAVGLILVLVMMIIAPMTMAHNDTPVTVPLARTAERKVEENLTISYTVEHELLLNDVRYEDLTSLGLQLEQEILRDPYILVVIRADKEVLHSEVLDILALARRAGALRIACATKRLDEGNS